MDSKLVVLVLVFFLVLGAFSIAVFYDQESLTQISASNQCEPDASKSFLVSIPKNVAPGQACEVNVFVRCADETSVIGTDVSLNVTNATANPTSAQTDETGKATFSVKGSGLSEITATIDNSLSLPQTVTCDFAQ